MKRCLVAALLLLAPVAASAQGLSRPGVRVVAALPGTCGQGTVVFHTGSPTGLHQCIATDTWQQLASGGGSGDVTGPANSTDEAIARFNLATGKVIQNSNITISDTGVITLPDNIRQIFNPGAAAAGINVGAQAADPSTPVDGDIWYDSDDHLYRLRVNGATVTLLHASSGLNATNLTSGTVPDARFPATLPAASGVNLTALNATNLSSGTVPDARFPSTLPAISGANLTNLDASDLTGTIASAVQDNITRTGTLATWGIGAAPTITDGTRITFNPDATNAGFNVGSHAGDPSTPSNGDCWYDSTANELTCRINGANVALGAGGAGGSVATDTIWDAPGDTVHGTGSNTAARLAIGTAGLVYRVNAGATAPEWGQVQTAGIGDGQVTLGKIANQAADTVLANITAGSAPPTAVSYSSLASEMGIVDMDTPPGNDAVTYYDFSDLRINFLSQLTVALGGTGAATLTGILQGNGTSAITGISNSSTVGQVFRVTGASTYAWGALDLADGDAITNDLPYANLTGASATSRFLCRVSASAGDWEECTAANAWTVLSIVPDANMPNLTGDVTTTEGAVATTIANDAVTYAKMQNVSATSRILGRITSGAGDPEELTAANVKTILATMELRPLTLFNAAGCDNTTPATGLNLFTSNRPTAACTTGTNTTFGRLQFTATGQQAQGHIHIASDVSGTSFTVSGHYFGETTSAGNTTWRFSWSRVTAGGTLDPSWNDCDITDAAGTANQLNTFTSTSCTITGLSANDLLFWKITYQTAPTTPGNHNLIDLVLQPLRAMAIGG